MWKASPRRSTWVFVSAVLVLSFLLPAASASGSGYNLSFSRNSGSTTNSHIDLVSLSSSDTGGGKLQVTLKVSGTLVLDDSQTSYSVFFGGGGQSNSTAWVTFNNNTTAGSEFASGTSFQFSSVPYTVGDSGSSLTFLINQTDVGPASSFSLNAYAVHGASSGASAGSSWIGSNYVGFPGGTIGNAVNTALWIYVGVLVGVLLIVVVIIVVVIIVVRRKKPPTQTYPPAYPPTDAAQGTPTSWAPTPYPPASPPPPPPPPSM